MSNTVQVKMREPSLPQRAQPQSNASSKATPTQAERTAAEDVLGKHSHMLAYGAIGLVAAVLIITIGLLPTMLIAVLVALGVAVGRYRDGDARMRGVARELAARMGK